MVHSFFLFHSSIGENLYGYDYQINLLLTRFPGMVAFSGFSAFNRCEQDSILQVL